MRYKTKKLNRLGFTMMESIMTMIILGVAMYMSLTFFDRLSLASKNEDIRLKTLAINTAMTEEIKSNFYNGTIYEEVMTGEITVGGNTYDREEAAYIGITEEDFLAEFISEKYSKEVTPENSDVGPYYTTDVTVEIVNLGINREFTEVEEKKAFLENIQKHDGAGYVDVSSADYVKYSSRFLSEIEHDGYDLNIELHDRVDSIVGGNISTSYYKSDGTFILPAEYSEEIVPSPRSYYRAKLNTETVADIIGKPLTIYYTIKILDGADVVDLLLEYVYKSDLISSSTDSSIYKIKVKTVYEYKETKDSEMTIFVTPQKNKVSGAIT